MKSIRHIYSENPYQKMWDTFVFFESEPTTKQFLLDTYKKLEFKDSFKYAFQNTSKFIYFIKQAKEYFFSAEKSSILVKPLLTYYGMMGLIKAYVLTRDPEYPSRAGVLRHGITTRKLKKSNYQFHDDEIKIQKDGLLPWFYTIKTGKPIDKIEGNKYKIKELLSLLPELHESYQRLFKEQTVFPITINQISDSSIELSVSRDILKLYQRDTKKFFHELTGYGSVSQCSFVLKENNQRDMITLEWNGTVENPLKYANIFNHPMLIQDYKGKYYLRTFNESRFLLPEIMIDYLLMYNLGMLCRYDTDLWGEIIFSFASEDMYIINEFVNITLRRFPNLILNALFDEMLIFDGN